MIDMLNLWIVFLALLAIMNPFSTALVFLSITIGDTKKERKKTSRKAAVVSFLILGIFLISGSLIFSFFNITIEAFRIAGGLLVGISGFRMLYPRPTNTEAEHKEAKNKEDVAVIPLAMPMLAGPGAITTILVLSSQSVGLVAQLALLIPIAMCCIIAFIALNYASTLKRVAGQTGTGVIQRLMGLIVIVVGIQFIVNGIKDIITGLL